MTPGEEGEEPAEEFDASAGPVYWPSLTAEEAEPEWESLRDWLERLRSRFPHAIRIPPCWWHHNDLVELLSALRDFERACFAPTAPPTAAVEWHRAFQDIEKRMDMWIKRFACAVPGREHPEPSSGWDEFILADAQARRDHLNTDE